MSSEIVFDLHTHSTASDGELTPEQLFSRAQGLGVSYLALTDHDTVAGVRSLEQCLQSKSKGGQLPSGTQLVPGVEITALAGPLCLHVLGLWIDSENDNLDDFLTRQREVRDVRGQRIAAALEKKTGVERAYTGAKAVADGAILARPHFARLLVQEEVCRNVQEAFARYLGDGKPGDVKCEWPALRAVIEVIQSAGGQAVLAHPDKYKLTKTKLRELLDLFASEGGDGIEVVSGAQSHDSSAYLAKLADQRGLGASSGSDFHGPGQLWCDLGRQPLMPDSARPVWQ